MSIPGEEARGAVNLEVDIASQVGALQKAARGVVNEAWESDENLAGIGTPHMTGEKVDYYDTPVNQILTGIAIGKRIVRSGLDEQGRVVRSAKIQETDKNGGKQLEESTILTPTNAIGLGRKSKAVKSHTSISTSEPGTVEIKERRESKARGTVVDRKVQISKQGVVVSQTTSRPDRELVVREWQTPTESSQDRQDGEAAVRIARRMVERASKQVGMYTTTKSATEEVYRRKGIEDAMQFFDKQRAKKDQSGN